MILIVSGATGGHLYPAIAMAETLKKAVFFIVSRNDPAKKILNSHNFDFKVVKLSKLLINPIMWLRIISIVLKQKPRLLIAMGGGICIPFTIVCWLCGVPVLCFEQNAIPGRATKSIQFFAKKIITAFEPVKSKLIVKSKVVCLGNPIRLSYPTGEKLPIDWSNFTGQTILVLGGSQGAKSINEFMQLNKAYLMKLGYNILHLAGDQFFNNNQSFIAEKINEKQYLALPYLTNMNQAYKVATIVMCRAGATTLAELIHWQLPSILIPYPHAMDDHQTENANAFLAISTASKIVTESQLNIESVEGALIELKARKTQAPLRSSEEKMNSICELINSYLE